MSLLFELLRCVECAVSCASCVSACAPSMHVFGQEWCDEVNASEESKDAYKKKRKDTEAKVLAGQLVIPEDPVHDVYFP